LRNDFLFISVRPRTSEGSDVLSISLCNSTRARGIKGLLRWHKYSSTIQVCLDGTKTFFSTYRNKISNRAKAANRANINRLLIGSLANQAYFFRQYFNNHNFIIFHIAFCYASLKHATSAGEIMDLSRHQAGYHLSRITPG
jgi:hypothetical protein